MKISKEQKNRLKKAKILLADIEVAPMLAYTYGYYETNVIKIVEHQKLLCFSYKWLGDDGEPETVCLTDGSVDPKNDKYIVQRLWDLLDSCNFAIFHNGAKYDCKMANMFFAEHNIAPPSPYKCIDTLQAAKKYFRFPSNKLDELGKFFELGQKTEVKCGDLWEACLKGDKKAYKLMAKYCANDVALMEKVYWKIMPFAQTPLLNKMINEELVCSVCGSTSFQRRGIVPDATQGPSWRYTCNCCGHQTKVPLSKLEREENEFVKPSNRNIGGCF